MRSEWIGWAIVSIGSGEAGADKRAQHHETALSATQGLALARANLWIEEQKAAWNVLDSSVGLKRRTD